MRCRTPDIPNRLSYFHLVGGGVPDAPFPDIPSAQPFFLRTRGIPKGGLPPLVVCGKGFQRENPSKGFSLGALLSGISSRIRRNTPAGGIKQICTMPRCSHRGLRMRNNQISVNRGRICNPPLRSPSSSNRHCATSHPHHRFIPRTSMLTLRPTADGNTQNGRERSKPFPAVVFFLIF